MSVLQKSGSFFPLGSQQLTGNGLSFIDSRRLNLGKIFFLISRLSQGVGFFPPLQLWDLIIVVIVVAGQGISFAFSKWLTDVNSPKFHFSQRNSLDHRPLKMQVAGLYHLDILIHWV